jgi:hypothetical protein
MALSRPLSQQEKWFIRTRVNLPTSMELRTPRLADEFAAFLIKHVQGFHLRTDDERFIVTDTPAEVEKLPPNVRTVFGMYGYAEYGLEVDYATRLGRVAVNGCNVAWNLPHGLYDGVSLSHLATWFERGNAPPPQIFPDAPDTALADQLLKVTDAARHAKEIAQTTKLAWSHPPIKFPVGTRNDSYEVALPYSSLPCYNPKTNKFVGLSDIMWRSAPIIGHAYTPGQKNFSFSTWVNLRPYMKPTTVGNTITPVVIEAPGADETWTLNKLQDVIRRNFTDKIKDKAYLRSLAAFDENVPFEMPTAAYFDVSNSGYYPAGGKIVDMFLVQSMPTQACILALPWGAATNYGGSRDRQFFRLPYSQAVFTRSDARKIFAAILHAVQHLRGNMTVKEAIIELRDVIEKTA